MSGVGILQSCPGTYALLLSSTTDDTIRVGRLGKLPLQRGFYVYVGSAHGPGGVRSRLAHHLRPCRRPHWHIDYLRPKTRVEDIWVSYGPRLREHEWARRLGEMPEASMPLAGFGSSDCGCKSHLFFFRQRRGVQLAFLPAVIAGRVKEIKPHG